MNELSQSIKAFFDDLREKRLADRVLLMTFSEFGRRAAENASLGTDHGVAAPLFVAGPSVASGVLGPRPDLEALVDGDVPYAIDFRRVYATVLQDWLNIAAGFFQSEGLRAAHPVAQHVGRNGGVHDLRHVGAGVREGHDGAGVLH